MNTLKLEVVRFDSEDVIATSTARRIGGPFPNGYGTLGAEAYEAGYNDVDGPLNNSSLYPIDLYSTNSDDFSVSAWDTLTEYSGYTYAWYIGGGIDAWYTEDKPIYHYTETGTKFPR